jgi:hypothetical protein
MKTLSFSLAAALLATANANPAIVQPVEHQVCQSAAHSSIAFTGEATHYHVALFHGLGNGCLFVARFLPRP